MSNPFIRYPLVLLIVAAAAGAALYATFMGTKDEIAKQEAAARTKALGKVFLSGCGATEEVRVDGKLVYMKVWRGEEKAGEPDFFAAMGAGVGYNSAVPIELLAGFTNPTKPGPESGNKAEMILIGWSVTKSEETPGLGEKIKESKAPYTIAELVTGSTQEAQVDLRTDFQRQFADAKAGKRYTPDQLKLKKNGGPIDVITGATYTSEGVILAIQDAATKLKSALQ